MVGVVGSSPIAPTKFGRRIKHLAETLSAFFLVDLREKRIEQRESRTVGHSGGHSCVISSEVDKQMRSASGYINSGSSDLSIRMNVRLP